ncbi:unnamed protein product [Protopolystoma xenopodis]|uniref:PDZ domain-containing protein n=1 Tax=Protopolystoma xenopodis TaxID=117903 RepID=A0A3S5CCJ7_9PLAT|nr:unnamed protein product [Protopolystoma xenopodis]
MVRGLNKGDEPDICKHVNESLGALLGEATVDMLLKSRPASSGILTDIAKLYHSIGFSDVHDVTVLRDVKGDLGFGFFVASSQAGERLEKCTEPIFSASLPEIKSDSTSTLEDCDKDKLALEMLSAARLVPGSPAERLSDKLCIGDRILAVNGRSILRLSHDAVVRLIRESGDHVIITILPAASVIASNRGSC